MMKKITFRTIAAAKEYCDSDEIPHSEIHNDYFSGCPYIIVDVDDDPCEDTREIYPGAGHSMSDF